VKETVPGGERGNCMLGAICDTWLGTGDSDHVGRWIGKGEGASAGKGKGSATLGLRIGKGKRSATQGLQASGQAAGESMSWWSGRRAHETAAE